MRSRCVGGGPGTEAASRAPPASLPSPSAGYLLSSLLIGPPLAVGGGLALPGRAGQPVFFWANPRRPLSVGGPTQGDAESSGLPDPPVEVHDGHRPPRRGRTRRTLRPPQSWPGVGLPAPDAGPGAAGRYAASP